MFSVLTSLQQHTRDTTAVLTGSFKTNPRGYIANIYRIYESDATKGIKQSRCHSNNVPILP